MYYTMGVQSRADPPWFRCEGAAALADALAHVPKLSSLDFRLRALFREVASLISKMWHKQGSHGQILALAFRQKSLNPFEVFFFRAG